MILVCTHTKQNNTDDVDVTPIVQYNTGDLSVIPTVQYNAGGSLENQSISDMNNGRLHLPGAGWLKYLEARERRLETGVEYKNIYSNINVRAKHYLECVIVCSFTCNSVNLGVN